MSHGLSFEITIPEHVDESAVISIGERCVDKGWEGITTVSEALEWAFANPVAIAQLLALGVSWNIISTGR